MDKKIEDFEIWERFLTLPFQLIDLVFNRCLRYWGSSTQQKLSRGIEQTGNIIRSKNVYSPILFIRITLMYNFYYV